MHHALKIISIPITGVAIKMHAYTFYCSLFVYMWAHNVFACNVYGTLCVAYMLCSCVSLFVCLCMYHACTHVCTYICSCVCVVIVCVCACAWVGGVGQ